MLDIQTVSIAIASAGVFVAAIYYILQLRHQSNIRDTDLVMRLYSTYGSKEYSDASLKVLNLEFKDYNDFVQRYGPWNSETEVYSAIRMICVFFNGIGILLLKKLVDIEMVSSMFTLPTTSVWEKVQPLVQGGRRQYGSHLYEDFEYLYNELKKREQKGVSNG